MIQTCDGAEITVLLKAVTARPDRFAALTLCSPFVDHEIALRVSTAVEAALRAGLTVNVITTPTGAQALSQRLGASARSVVRVVASLHAKVYVIRAREARQSRAIVSSANLTKGGVVANLELGVSTQPTSLEGERLFNQIVAFTHTLVSPNIGRAQRLRLKRSNV